MTTSKQPRRSKTPRQRVQEQLDVEERRVKRLTDQAKKLRGELEQVDRERDRAVVRRDYLKKHPDLAINTGGTVSTSTTGGTK